MTKNQIVTELYSTGKLDGNYFGRKSKEAVNPVKYHIKNLLCKNGLSGDTDLIDDCYNEAFLHLWKMDDAVFMQAYAVSPQKIIAMLLQLINWKCFARISTGNPRHSFVEMFRFMSAKFDCIDVFDPGKPIENTFNIYNSLHGKNNVFVDNDDSINKYIDSDFKVSIGVSASEFEQKYGFDFEFIYDQLTKPERVRFDAMVRAVKLKGKVTELKDQNLIAKREVLIDKIKNIKQAFNY